MTETKILHFDTLNGVEFYDESYSKRGFLTGQTTNSGHCYNTKLKIERPLQNVKRIELNSIEFPFTTNNIRASNKSNLLLINPTYQGIDYELEVYVKQKNYISISELLTDINNSITIAIQAQGINGFTFSFSLNPLDLSKVIAKCNCDTAQGGLLFGTCDIEKTILSEIILGVAYEVNSNNDIFIGNTQTGVSTLVCTSNYNLQPDNFFSIVLKNINSGGSNNANGIIASSFKLPLACSYGEVMYYTSGNNFIQTLMIDNNQTINELHFTIKDRFGFDVYGDTHVSFTLTFYI